MIFEIVIIAYQPKNQINALLDSIKASDQISPNDINILIWDNSTDPESIYAVDQLIKDYPDLIITIHRCQENLGFGQGVNHAVKQSNSKWILVLNQDIKLLPTTLFDLQQQIPKQAKNVAAIELRQIPYEHPKDYNLKTLETSWITGAAFCIKKEHFDQVGGFDRHIFMYGEDVDLSWRLRANGFCLKYIPNLAVIHKTYQTPNEIKPLQITEGILTNLLLRARYGSIIDILKGYCFFIIEIFRKQQFPKKRQNILKLIPRYLKLCCYFRQSGKVYRKKGFTPEFLLWNYSRHRIGAFYPFEPTFIDSSYPLVSLIIRTVNRPNLLQEALLSVSHQIYPNIEVIVVEDGENRSQTVIDTFSNQLNIKYIVIGNNQGRSVAGNKGLAMAKGQWISFLDDDDQIYADHIWVLLTEAICQQKKATYTTAFEVQTKFFANSYQEQFIFTRYATPFSTVQLLKSNYLPIQSVLFHRSLYDTLGGFSTDLDQLEDWLLWMTYSLHHEFVYIEKTTSRYRVPAEIEQSITRQRKLYQAYQTIQQKQKSLPDLVISPTRLTKELKQYVSSEIWLGIKKQTIREFLIQHQNKKIFSTLLQIRDKLRKLITRLK